MAGCHVSGCTRAGTDVWVEPGIGSGDIRAEWFVCHEHYVQLCDGTAFSVAMAGARRVLLIGDDPRPG